MEEECLDVLNETTKEFLYRNIADGLQFVDVSDKALCSNCGLVPIYHYLLECDHPYCRSCYLLFSAEERKCRKCSVRVGKKVKQSKDLEKLISSLQVYCTKREDGCTAIVELKDLMRHEKLCNFQKLLPKLYVEQVDDSANEIIGNLNTLSEEIQTIKMLLLKDRNRKPSSEFDMNEFTEATKLSISTNVEKLNLKVEMQLSGMERRIKHQFTLIDTRINDLQAKMDTKLTDIARQCQDTKKAKATETTDDQKQMHQHLRVSCDACHKLLFGFRYACIQCSDFDLCEDCEPHARHHHLMLRIPKSLDNDSKLTLRQIRQDKISKHNSAVINGATCNECAEYIVGVRYHCLSCEVATYDLCARCEKKHLHPQHYMMRIADQQAPYNLIEEKYPNIKELVKTKMRYE